MGPSEKYLNAGFVYLYRGSITSEDFKEVAERF